MCNDGSCSMIFFLSAETLNSIHLFYAFYAVILYILPELGIPLGECFICFRKDLFYKWQKKESVTLSS